MPAFVSTLCICIVFVPMFFLTGVARSLFVPLAEAVVFAMLASYFLSRTLVPTMAKYLLKPHSVHNEGKGFFARFQRGFEERFERFRMAYRRMLEGALREAERFRGYRAAGVNRVSLGVQALDDASLKELGRLHTAQEALDAVAVARSIFERYSFDLIYARPTPDAARLGRRTAARDRRSGRASVALSAHHRARHAVRRVAQGRQARHSRRRHRPRALRHDAGDLRQGRPAGLRDFQSCAARRGVPAQSDLLARP